ncbi:MAG TPA: tRNA (guanosine(37)-N1)-methyltransferase TrmD [Planctomycetota bacterium]|nr:tRNA (guanosine(37)-N1)-methyltransferase TrmD [Planctomycetota bacterium]
MRIDVVTLFPAMFAGVIGESILKIARDKGALDIRLVDLRDFTTDKHRKVDAPPFGGGPGMVIMADPVFRAVEHLRAHGAADSELVLLSPAGRKLDQRLARKLAKAAGLILLCGHYEGFDERVSEGLKPLEVSIGDYVLTGGELPAMVLLDAVGRLQPGVVGCAGSLEEESFSDGRLEYPHYTKPREVRGMKVPDVLVSGHHAKIAEWRRKKSEERTAGRRPDLARKKSKKKER